MRDDIYIDDSDFDKWIIVDEEGTPIGVKDNAPKDVKERYHRFTSGGVVINGVFVRV